MESREDTKGAALPDLSRLGIFPVSFNQERVILSRLAAKRQSVQVAPSIIGTAFRFRDNIDIDRLHTALGEIAGRHSALRVRFTDNILVSPPERERQLQRFFRTGVCDDTLHTQSIGESSEVTISQVDLSGQDASQHDSAVRGLTREEGLRFFEDWESPRIRGTLIRTGAREHLLVLFMDHLVCDGFSTRIIGRELRYLLAGRVLERLHTSFPAFAAWQRRALHRSYFDRAIRYWRDQWAQFAAARIAIQELPFALKPPETKLKQGFGTELELLSVAEAEEVRSFARRTRKTIFMIWLAAIAVVLG